MHLDLKSIPVLFIKPCVKEINVLIYPILECITYFLDFEFLERFYFEFPERSYKVLFSITKKSVGTLHK